MKIKEKGGGTHSSQPPHGYDHKDTTNNNVFQRFKQLFGTPGRLCNLMRDKVAELKNWWERINRQADENAVIIERMVQLWREAGNERH